MDERKAALWIHAYHLIGDMSLKENAPKDILPDMSVDELNKELNKEYPVPKDMEIKYDQFKQVFSVRGKTMPFVWHCMCLQYCIKCWDKVGDIRMVGTIAERNLYFLVWNSHYNHPTTRQYIYKKEALKYTSLTEYLKSLGCDSQNLIDLLNDNGEELFPQVLNAVRHIQSFVDTTNTSE